jgi:hypothetical protein
MRIVSTIDSGDRSLLSMLTASAAALSGECSRVLSILSRRMTSARMTS